MQEAQSPPVLTDQQALEVEKASRKALIEVFLRGRSGIERPVSTPGHMIWVGLALAAGLLLAVLLLGMIARTLGG